MLNPINVYAVVCLDGAFTLLQPSELVDAQLAAAHEIFSCVRKRLPAQPGVLLPSGFDLVGDAVEFVGNDVEMTTGGFLVGIDQAARVVPRADGDAGATLTVEILKRFSGDEVDDAAAADGDGEPDSDETPVDSDGEEDGEGAFEIANHEGELFVL